MSNNGHNNSSHSLCTLLYNVTLLLLLSRGGIYFSTSWIRAWPCDLLWPIGCWKMSPRTIKVLARWNLSSLATLRTLSHQVTKSASWKGPVENKFPTLTYPGQSLPTNIWAKLFFQKPNHQQPQRSIQPNQTANPQTHELVNDLSH